MEFDGSREKYVLACESKHFFKKNTKTLGVSSYVFCVYICGFVGPVADKVKLAEEERPPPLPACLEISTT